MAPGHSGWGTSMITPCFQTCTRLNFGAQTLSVMVLLREQSLYTRGILLQEHAPGILGATVFSWAVSSFGLVSSTREETSATQGSSRGTLREQSSSVCTNDFMGILHPWEQHFHPAKCSTVFNRLNVWEQAPGTNWANLKTLPRVYRLMQNEPGACVGSKTPCALKVGQ